MSAAEGEAADTAGKPTYAASTTGVYLTAAAPGTGAGWRPVARELTSSSKLVEERLGVREVESGTR